METINHPDFDNKQNKCRDRRHPVGRVFGGLVIIAVGGVLLARQAGIFFPEWLFTWQMSLIVLGVYFGFRNMFQNGVWFIPILIGGIMMIDEFYPEVQMKQYLWPAVIICIGLFMVLRPKNYHRNQWKKKWKRESAINHMMPNSREEFLDVTCVFSGVKRNIVTKDFKGGEVNCCFGGTEINLLNADITGQVKLEINQVFGGTSLIIPAHWQLRSEINAILGGVEDKRFINSTTVTDADKILVLEGNCVFGGIEIRNY